MFPLTCASLCDRYMDECVIAHQTPDARQECLADCGDHADPQIIKCIIEQLWQPWSGMLQCQNCSACKPPRISELKIGNCPSLK